MRANAIAGPWAAGERVLVCVGEDAAARRRWCAMPGASPTGCMRPGRRCTSRRRRSAAAAGRGARPHRRQPAAGRAARRRGGDAARRRAAIADDILAYARAQQRRPRSSSASRPARAGSRSCTARWCTSWSAGPAAISVHVIAGEEEPAGMAPTADRAHPARGRAPGSAALRRGAAGDRRRLRGGEADRAAGRARDRSTWCS